MGVEYVRVVHVGRGNGPAFNGVTATVHDVPVAAAAALSDVGELETTVGEIAIVDSEAAAVACPGRRVAQRLHL